MALVDGRDLKKISVMEDILEQSFEAWAFKSDALAEVGDAQEFISRAQDDEAATILAPAVLARNTACAVAKTERAMPTNFRTQRNIAKVRQGARGVWRQRGLHCYFQECDCSVCT